MYKFFALTQSETCTLTYCYMELLIDFTCFIYFVM